MNARATRRFVAYYRVSTDRQGRSGLGLEAQQKAVMDFLNGGAWELVGEFVEVESGKRSDRPELARAIDACRKHKARLVIAKLDRLSRNLAFVATLMDSGVEFVAVDNPHANKLTIHILAAVAEHEREAISERTKAALAAAKARGRRLGTPDPAGAVERMRVSRKAQAAQFAANVLPIIRDVQAAGFTSLNAIAGQLNARKVATANGGQWRHVQVRQILDRASVVTTSNTPRRSFELKVASSGRMDDFVSEDDLDTFEGWLRYQGIDSAQLLAADLARWRADFDEIRNGPRCKVGLMKLKPVVGEHRYAVAVREGSDLWLTLWVRRSKKGEYFVMVPRADRHWDPHVSYHLDGTFHSKSFGGPPRMPRKLQPLTGPFRGTETLGAHSGHGPKRVGAVCDPTAFAGILELPPGVLGPNDGDVLVDLVEPGCAPISWPGRMVAEAVFKDTEPWVVIRVFRK